MVEHPQTGFGRTGKTPQQWLTQWGAAAPRFSHYCGAQKILDKPYIIERNIDGALVWLLIANVEGQLWYDRIGYTEAIHFHAFGMLREGDVVLDCGANQGFNTLVYSHLVGALGHVHAFDPFPLNMEIVRLNLAMNNVSNVTTYMAGLSDKAGTVTVSVNDQSVSEVFSGSGTSDMETLSLVQIDTFVDLQPDFLKIDIEGAEINALRGAKEVLRNVPAVYLEIHEAIKTSFNQDIMEIFDHLSPSKYTFYLAHPTKGLIEYNLEFEIDTHGALFAIPKDRAPIRRHYSDEPFVPSLAKTKSSVFGTIRSALHAIR